MERLRKRHKGDETALETLKVLHWSEFADLISYFQTTYEGFEGAGENEENTIGVNITTDMSPEDVVNKTIEMLKNNQQSQMQQ